MYLRADPSMVGNCHVKLESAGSASGSDVFIIIPNVVREMAAQVIERCVVEKRGSGGFITAGIDLMIRHFAQPTTHFDDPYRKPSLLTLNIRVNLSATGI